METVVVYSSKNGRAIASLTESQIKKLGSKFAELLEQGDVWSVYVSRTGKIFWTSNFGLTVHKTTIVAHLDFDIHKRF